VTVRLGEETADARSVLALMSLGARQGDRVEIRAAGEQAAEALERLRDLVERNFDE
jgi:PTS hybrid protein